MTTTIEKTLSICGILSLIEEDQEVKPEWVSPELAEDLFTLAEYYADYSRQAYQRVDRCRMEAMWDFVAAYRRQAIKAQVVEMRLRELAKQLRRSQSYA